MNGTDSAQATQKRLAEIEKEIGLLTKQKDDLKKHWENEKFYIQKIQSIKTEIEEAKHRAGEFEREGDLAKVAEVRYGTIHNLETQLNSAGVSLNELQKVGKMLKEEVDAEDIAEIISKWTGIPIQKMLETERTKLIKMESRLHRRVIGQEEAVSAIANAIRRSRAGLHDPKKPLGSFIFLGSTGVGKTEMARALAEFLFDDENALIRIDMSEYMEKFSVSRLIGAPPGYVGYEEGGQLTESIRRKPYSVVLLDEIEKASPEVFNVLLQVLDDGRLTDGKGRTVSFKNSIIIMTSNLGAELIGEVIAKADNIQTDETLGKVKNKIIELMRKKMRPEFLNRIDEIILFKPLAIAEMREIAGLQLGLLANKLAASNIGLRVEPKAMQWLTKLGFDPQYGARPLKRAIQKHIANPLSLHLLSSDFVPGDEIIIGFESPDSFTFSKSSR